MKNFSIGAELYNELTNVFEYVNDKMPLIRDEYEPSYVRKIEHILEGEYNYDTMKNLRNLLYEGGDNMMSFEIINAHSHCCEILRDIRRANS